MTFNVEKFKQLDLQFRIKEIPVTDPDIASCFDVPAVAKPKKGEKAPKSKPPVWKIRNMTGQETAQVNQAADTVRMQGALISKLLGGSTDEKVTALMEAFGLSKDKLAPDYVRRLAMLELCSVEPVVDRPTAVLLATNKSTFFYDVTNQIILLTGQGNCPGKQIASGETPG